MRFTLLLTLLVHFANNPILAFLSSVSDGRKSIISSLSPGADIEQPSTDEEVSSVSTKEASVKNLIRGKVNEIDFCVAPGDVSLSRYNMKNNDGVSSTRTQSNMSLTLALNNASNRVIRRILLARSWPSAKALNESFRQVAAAEKEREQSGVNGAEDAASRCPVPRPILNILMRRREDPQNSISNQPEARKSRTDEEYVNDQLLSFAQKYSDLPDYSDAEAYLESVLSLATSGEESPRVSEVMKSGAYGESYKRMIAVLKTVGAKFEEIPDTNRCRIATKLVDQDICLAPIDKLNMKQKKNSLSKPQSIVPDESGKESRSSVKSENKSSRLKFWKRDHSKRKQSVDSSGDDAEGDKGVQLTQEDLGGVLLSAEEPSMTRNLNVLSNIVQRALLFGGDQELLVLYETLVADMPPFIERWYPGTGGVLGEEQFDEETRPGVQYLNCLIRLLSDCCANGYVNELEPPLPLTQSYRNAYERLMASLVELGSGYVKPISGSVMKMRKPRTPTEELGRFAIWESTFRKEASDTVASYPEDLEGSWEVRDEIGGETIGVSTVVLKSQGQVEVASPMEGLRWRLDPGPTHLDTCTFQVLGDDGAILQYRGFIDRGARLESRFSKRPIKIRGSVMFQMRDGDAVGSGEDYWKDILPVDYKTGATKFVMTKQMNSN